MPEAELAHTHAGADQPCDQVVQGGQRSTHQERLGVMTLGQLVAFEDAQIPNLGGNSPGRERIGDAQPVVQFVGMGDELADWSGEDHATGGEEGDLAAHHGQIIHPMAGEDDRGAVRRQPGQYTVHVTGAGRIKAVRRFVEHQQPRPGQQRGGQTETLAHPEREAANAVVGNIGEPDLLQRIADAVEAVAPQASQRGQVLPSRKRGIQARPIHEPSDPVRNGERSAHRTAENLQLPAVGLRKPEEQAQERRLSGTVRSDQTMDVARRDVEVDSVEGDDITKGFADPARANRRRFGHPILGRCLRHPSRLC
jgi:hypothetical protein